MGRNLHYRPGSFYRVDDRTGFPQRAERTRKEWNGLIVEQSVYEPRQPQDLVKGVKDDQSVPEARPLAPPVYIGPIYAQVSADVPIGDYFIPLDSTAYMTVGDEVRVMLVTNELFTTGIAGILDNGILLYDPVPNVVPSAVLPNGNQVVDYRIPFHPPPALFAYILTEDFRLLATENGRPLIQE